MGVYLDHAATTPVRPEVVAVVAAQLRSLGNPSSLHAAGRAARKSVEESRERVADALGARPCEVVFTSGGTEADNLAVKGLFWSRRSADPARVRVIVCAVEHHAVLDAVQWLGEAPGRRQSNGAGRRARPGGHPGRCDRRWRRDPASVALVTSCGRTTRSAPFSPYARWWPPRAIRHSGALRRRAGGRSGAGRLRARAGWPRCRSTGHKMGGPMGVGALLLRPDVELVPVLHGGGQERDVRSGTLDVAGAAGFAECGRDGHGGPGCRSAAARRAAPRPCPCGPGCGARRRAQRRPDCRRTSARQRSLLLSWLRGRLAVDAAGRRGIECSTGSACSAGVAQPSHVLARHGRSGGAGPRVAALHARPHVDRSRRRGTGGGDRTRSRACPGRRVWPSGDGTADDAVLAAMSGGVDSAVAAARCVDAGHDVTGVHLALSANPQSFRSGARGCCTLEDARDARRAADVLGIPFYVWDLAERFRADVVADFVAEYAAGRTPNPCLRCNEKIKFAAVLDRALALGFDAVCTGHYARLVDGTSGRELHRAADPGQGPVLRPRRADRRSAGACACSRSAATSRPRSAPRQPDEGWPSRTSRTATTSASSRTATPPGFLRRAAGRCAGRDRRPGRVGRRRARRRLRATPSGSGEGLRIGRPAPDGKPRYVLDISPVERRVTVGPAEALAVDEVVGVKPRWCGAPPPGPLECLAQYRAHGSASSGIGRAGRRGGHRALRLTAARRRPRTGSCALRRHQGHRLGHHRPHGEHRNDHVHHPCRYVTRLVGLVMYQLAW